jgi:flagellar FliL protein
MSEKKNDSHEADAASDDAQNGENAGAEGGQKKKIPLLLIIGGAVVLLLGAGAGLYFSGMLDSLLGKAPAEEQAEGHEEGHGEQGEKSGKDKSHDKKSDHAAKKEDKGHGGGHGKEGEGGNFVEIPPMIINLNTDDGSARFLRLSVKLELEDPADHAAVTAVIPRVIDQFQTYLRELRVKDLRGSAGIYRLQMELLWRVNQAAEPVKIKDVLFQEILIQ